MNVYRRNIMSYTCLIAILTCIVLQRCTITSGSTHWIVTEDGKVQSQADSVFNLRRPYDLVAFLKQEDRATMLNDLKKELLSRKDEIDRNEDRDTAGLEQKFYKSDPDCIEAGKRLPEFDLYISTVLPLENKGIRPEEHIDINAAPSSSPKAPDCTDFMDLEFSMHAFEHMEGMKARSNLSGTAELGLKNAITHRENVDDYGHLVFEALHKNKTSWVLYNMAAFYWRIKGNTHQAVECIRRALHRSPRLQKDVALISLANILHRARYCNEAAILVHSALEVSKELNVNHFTLGNIYAVLGEYNKSIICFENTLKIQPDFGAAAKLRHAVFCHSKLEQALEAQHRSLQKTLQDLKDYQRKHDLYQAQSDKLLSEQVPHEMKVAQHIIYEQQRMREQVAEKDEYCRMVDRNGKQVLLCKWGRRSPTLDLDFAFFEEEPVDLPIAKEEKLIGEKKVEEHKVSNTVDYSLPVKAPLYSKYKKHKPSESDLYTQESWPDKEECDSLVKQVPDPRNLTTVYLSPENKGFEVKELLTDAQGLSTGDEHPLPWYRPICIPLLDLEEGNTAVYDNLKSVSYSERYRIPKYNDLSMQKILLSHVNEGLITEEEVGQRILTALKKNIGPQWILYNLAGLYWRIVGDNFHGIECLRRSIHLCPAQYKDIPLVNLANILYRHGRYDDAVVIMNDALKVSDVEPSSHFLMGHLMWAIRNFTGAAHHYQEALAMDPGHQGALDTLRAMKCYLKFHYAAQSAAPLESPAMAVGTNCHNKGKETENRVICKTENNEEKCIIETRSRARLADCIGQCTQTCTISPIKLDGCSTDLNLENAIIGHCSGKGGKPFSSDQEDILFSGDFTSRLEDVSEHYEKKGVCHGDECGHLRVQSPLQQSPGPKPHTKLEYVEGVLRHKLIFLQISPSEMEVSPEDCVIFNDGTKSAGCSREEFQTYVEELDRDMEAMQKWLARSSSSSSSREDFDPDKLLLQNVEFMNTASQEEYVDLTVGALKYPKAVFQDNEEDVDADEELEIHWLSREEEEEYEKYLLESGHVSDAVVEKPEKKQKKENNEDQKKKKIEKEKGVQPYSGYPPPLKPPQNFKITFTAKHNYYVMPNTHVHLKTRKVPAHSYLSDCQHAVKTESGFLSSWIGLESMNINVDHWVKFVEKCPSVEAEPVCPDGLASPVMSLDHLPGVLNRADLKSVPEPVFKDSILGASHKSASQCQIKATLVQAMLRNTSSWLAYYSASLYWRLHGNAKHAIDCSRVAVTYAPYHLRHIPLLSMANILQFSSQTNEAIIATSAAMDISNSVYSMHYTMALLYAAKSDWTNYALFLQSSLALSDAPCMSESLMKRLRNVYCTDLVPNHLFTIP